MRTVTAMQLRARLGELLDRAAAGERIVIERDRRPMAVLVPYRDATRLDERESEQRTTRALDALARLKEIRRAATTMHLDPASVIRSERDRGHRG